MGVLGHSSWRCSNPAPADAPQPWLPFTPSSPASRKPCLASNPAHWVHSMPPLSPSTSSNPSPKRRKNAYITYICLCFLALGVFRAAPRGAAHTAAQREGLQAPCPPYPQPTPKPGCKGHPRLPGSARPARPSAAPLPAVPPIIKRSLSCYQAVTVSAIGFLLSVRKAK